MTQTPDTLAHINRIGEQCDSMQDAENLGWRGSAGVEVSGYYYDIADTNGGMPENLIGAFMRDLSSALRFLADNAEPEEYDPGEHALRRWEAAQQEG